MYVLFFASYMKDLGKWLYNVVQSADWTSKWKDIVKMFVFVLNLFKVSTFSNCSVYKYAFETK